MTKEEVLRLEEAVLAEIPDAYKRRFEEPIRAAVRFAAQCSVSKASFSQTRPPIPIVTLKNGRCQPCIRVVQGKAVPAIVGGFLNAVRQDADSDVVVEAVRRAVPRVEIWVAASAKNLLDDKEAVAKKKEQIRKELEQARKAARERLLREARGLVKDGWSEEDFVQVYREAVVAEVHES